MQRGLAILLASLFSWMLMLPVFTTASTPAVSPCCRRNGKHHCLMPAATTQLPGISVASLSEKCPYLPHAMTNAYGAARQLATATFTFNGRLDQTAVLAEADAGYRVSFHCSRQKRGPPPLLHS
jgi:hypothetical protein